ncbi:MAG: sensor histidine kinase [Rhodocyclaceae bacterium]|nr:sensor histidine kinase [Rhodocyclaceae bacterium]
MDDLVAAVIHDAKNALMTLDARLAESERRPASADFCALRADVAKLAGTLTELLTLYRAQRGLLRLAIDDHDLADFLDELAIELGPPPAGLSLDFDRAAALRLGAWAFDAYLVRLALADAVRNALRHARHRVTLTVDTPPAGGLCFTVADDGPGFPEALLIGAAAVGSDGGTGLGLAFARLIAERHVTPDGRRGRVELANAGGAVFSLRLP